MHDRRVEHEIRSLLQPLPQANAAAEHHRKKRAARGASHFRTTALVRFESGKHAALEPKQGKCLKWGSVQRKEAACERNGQMYVATGSPNVNVGGLQVHSVPKRTP